MVDFGPAAKGTLDEKRRKEQRREEKTREEKRREENSWKDRKNGIEKSNEQAKLSI